MIAQPPAPRVRHDYNAIIGELTLTRADRPAAIVSSVLHEAVERVIGSASVVGDPVWGTFRAHVAAHPAGFEVTASVEIEPHPKEAA